MKHTKATDRDALNRVKTLGARSLNPDDYADLERVVALTESAVDRRTRDMDDRGFDNPRPSEAA